MFIKHYTSRNVYPPLFGFKTFESFMHMAISKENNHLDQNSSFLELYGRKFGHTTHPKVRRNVYWSGFPYRRSKGVWSLIILDGRQLIRKTTITKALSQNFRGMEACESMVMPISTMCWCLHLQTDFVDVCGDMRHDALCLCIGRKSLMLDILPPICLYNTDLSIKLSLNKFLEVMKTLKIFGLVL